MPPESWIPFFEWCEATFLGNAVRESIWLFPVLEATHLTTLCVLGGAVLVVDLRMMGLGLRQARIHELARHVRPLLIGSVVMMLSTGTLLFLSEAIKCFYNTAFWVKMPTLAIALVFTFTVRARMVRDDRFETCIRSRLLASISLALWFTVAAAGRWIGYS